MDLSRCSKQNAIFPLTLFSPFSSLLFPSYFSLVAVHLPYAPLFEHNCPLTTAAPHGAPTGSALSIFLSLSRGFPPEALYENAIYHCGSISLFTFCGFSRAPFRVGKFPGQENSLALGLPPVDGGFSYLNMRECVSTMSDLFVPFALMFFTRLFVTSVRQSLTSSDGRRELLLQLTSPWPTPPFDIKLCPLDIPFRPAPTPRAPPSPTLISTSLGPPGQAQHTMKVRSFVPGSAPPQVWWFTSRTMRDFWMWARIVLTFILPCRELASPFFKTENSFSHINRSALHPRFGQGFDSN